MKKLKSTKPKVTPSKETVSLGRPSSYKKEYCDLLIDHMAKGFSFESFGGLVEVRVARSTLYEWVKNYPDFSDAKEKGTLASLLHWERLGLTGVFMTEGFNSIVFQINMRNRFGWIDRNNAADRKIDSKEKIRFKL